MSDPFEPLDRDLRVVLLLGPLLAVLASGCTQDLRGIAPGNSTDICVCSR